MAEEELEPGEDYLVTDSKGLPDAHRPSVAEALSNKAFTPLFVAITCCSMMHCNVLRRLIVTFIVKRKRVAVVLVSMRGYVQVHGRQYRRR